MQPESRMHKSRTPKSRSPKSRSPKSRSLKSRSLKTGTIEQSVLVNAAPRGVRRTPTTSSGNRIISRTALRADS
jgi:hypothetical protein